MTATAHSSESAKLRNASTAPAARSFTPATNTGWTAWPRIWADAATAAAKASGSLGFGLSNRIGPGAGTKRCQIAQYFDLDRPALLETGHERTVDHGRRVFEVIKDN